MGPSGPPAAIRVFCSAPEKVHPMLRASSVCRSPAREAPREENVVAGAGSGGSCPPRVRRRGEPMPAVRTDEAGARVLRAEQPVYGLGLPWIRSGAERGPDRPADRETAVLDLETAVFQHLAAFPEHAVLSARAAVRTASSAESSGSFPCRRQQELPGSFHSPYL